ncbi:MAG: hypothetical protein LBV26_09320 [Bacteroidales bacterium]|jgi:hypothetical protein|nr:hypothetical protein [Bacteroidales bacterium]
MMLLINVFAMTPEEVDIMEILLTDVTRGMRFVPLVKNNFPGRKFDFPYGLRNISC